MATYVNLSVFDNHESTPDHRDIHASIDYLRDQVKKKKTTGKELLEQIKKRRKYVGENIPARLYLYSCFNYQ